MKKSRDDGCSPDCTYRGLYDGAQASLLSMTSKHAQNLQRVQKMRSSVIKLMKSNHPKLFSDLENELGDQFRNVDDRLLIAALEQLLIRTHTPTVDMSQLRVALEKHGFALPEEDDVESWAVIIAAQQPSPANVEPPHVPPLVSDVSVHRDTRFPDMVGGPRPLVVTSPSQDSLPEGADAFFHTQERHLHNDYDYDSTGPAGAADSAAVGGDVSTETDDVAVGDGAVGGGLSFPEFDMPDEPFTPASEPEPEPEPDTDDASAGGGVDDLLDMFDEPTPPLIPQPSADSTVSGLVDDFADMFDDTSTPPLVPASVSPPDTALPHTNGTRTPVSVMERDTHGPLLDLFGDITPASVSAGTLSGEASPSVPAPSTLTTATPALDTHKRDEQLPVSLLIHTSTAPAATAPVRPMLGVPQRNSNSGRAARAGAKRSSTMSATKPAGPVPPPEMTAGEKREINALLVLPRPVFLSDIANILGDQRAEQWFHHTKSNRDSGLRFLTAKARWKDGPLIITTPEAKSPLQVADTSGWSEMLMTYRGTHLYAAAQLMKHLGTSIVSLHVDTHAFGMRVQQNSSVYAIVVGVGDDYRQESPTRHQVDGLVLKFIKNRMTHIDILTTSGQKKVFDALLAAVAEDLPGWNPSIPIRVGFSHLVGTTTPLTEVFQP